MSRKQHGINGCFYGGKWVDMEDLHNVVPVCRNFNDKFKKSHANNLNLDVYDVAIVGAGCIGGAVARELSKYNLSVVVLEAADDVSQGATKGNSGIVHSGYDDIPGSRRAQFCWKGNQMFDELDKELHFGFQRNGSLVVAFNEKDMHELQTLLDQGLKNGCKNLKIISKKELLEMEPNVNPEAIAALYSPDAGNVIPYEYAIGLFENAIENGVELRLRRSVVDIKKIPLSGEISTSKKRGKVSIEADNDILEISCNYWEPSNYLVNKPKNMNIFEFFLLPVAFIIGVSACHMMQLAVKLTINAVVVNTLGGLVAAAFVAVIRFFRTKESNACGVMNNVSNNSPVSVDEMAVGGTGSISQNNGVVVAQEKIRARVVINCAGSYADKIAGMVGDTSFKIQPRLGDYLLLNKSQGSLVSCTLFPCPDKILGKGVLVQTTLWGNLILGPTARDVNNPKHRDMSKQDIQEYIVSKCKNLVPAFDASTVIHAFAGARAKSTRGDWIIETSSVEGKMVHVCGIDSPGLAGSPAIALEVIRILRDEIGFTELKMGIKKDFNPFRKPIITPKHKSLKGLKFGDPGVAKSMQENVVCKCERVTELEIVEACHRAIPIDSTQAIRKRTRAGMGHCQGDPENYCCEDRVAAIIARETGIPVGAVGRRPWPGTSTLDGRWMTDEEKLRMINSAMRS